MRNPDDCNPENILPCGPLELNPEAIRNEIDGDRYAIAISAASLVLSVTLTAIEVVPHILHAAETSDVGEMLNYGPVGAFTIGLSLLAISNIKSYRARLKQALFNRQFYKITGESDLNPGT